jgi:glycosyltransferase involved in cell wall biosynthesis
LKVVEALANRLPIVATTIGVEGIDVVDGVHALVADDAASFASACSRLLEEPELRATLADAGELLWEAHYRWSAIRRELGELVAAVAAGGQVPGIGSRTTAGE